MSAEPFVGPEPGAAPRAEADPAVEAMSFEQALAELEAVVQRLERGQLALEASIAAYARGTELRQHCEEKLRKAQHRVEEITLDRDGKPKLAAFEADGAPFARRGDERRRRRRGARARPLLPRLGEVPAVLGDAMRHAGLGGGKRFRPFSAWAPVACSASDEAAHLARRRRGRADPRLHARPRRPAVHGRRRAPAGPPDRPQALGRRERGPGRRRAAGARLRGPGPRRLHVAPDQRAELVLGLARAAGPAGMFGGQTLDLEAEHQPPDDPASSASRP